MKTKLLCLLLLSVVMNQTFAQYWEPLGGGVVEGVQVTDLAVDTFHNILYVGGALTSYYVGIILVFLRDWVKDW